MHSPKPHLTLHRRRRLALWALAMLAWIAAALFADAGAGGSSARHLRQRGKRMSLDGLTLMVKQLILVRAAELAKLRRRKRLIFFLHGRDLRRPHLMRSAFGSRLRRALKRRDLAARIAILVDALADLDAWAAAFAKRMMRGFTRLHAQTPEASPPAACIVLAAPAPFAADSS